MHVSLIKEVLKRKLVDEVWIVPCKKHPLQKHLADSKDRMRMIKLALRGIKHIRINNFEIKQKGKNYTIKTIKAFKKKYKHKFYYIIGSDILYEIKKWHNYKGLLKNIEFIVLKRKGYLVLKIKDMKIYSFTNLGGRNISSTLIRERVKQGKSINKLVPKKVAEYIYKKRLYG